MNRFLRLFNLEFFTRLILVTAFVIVARYFAQHIVAEKSIQLVSIIFGSAIALLILKRPINGLLALPFVSYLIPAELNVTGISILSPGLIISAITLIGALLHITFKRIHPNFSWIWILLLAMGINMGFVIERTGGYGWYTMLRFVQGITPFLIFSLIVNTETDGRRVLKYWLVAYACFSLSHLIRGELGSSAETLLQGLANVRITELGGHNPNTLGWVGLLYLPLAPAIILGSNNSRERWKWWLVFFSIVSLLIFTFSRSAMAGTFLTISLFVVFFNKQIKGSRILFVPILATLILFYVVWAMSVSLGVIDDSRIIAQSSLSPVFGERWQMVVQGWHLVSLHPWSGWGIHSGHGAHSGFTKAALEYGLFYFLLFCIPFIYFIKTSRILAKSILEPKVKLFALAMLVVGIVAVIETLFGTTLFAAGYAQVFWLFIGYLYLAHHEAILMKIKSRRI